MNSGAKMKKKIKLVKGGIMSEYTGRFVLLQKDIPNLYPKLLHPMHGIDKMSTLNFIFHLQV